MAGNTVVILLSLALLIAVGALLVGVGRIVYGIIHYYVRERQPVCEVEHPAYGRLTGEGGLWSGIARSGGRRVRFTVAGTKLAPDGVLLKGVGGILDRFAEVEKQAAEFLRTKESVVSGASLEVYGLEVTDQQHPDDFTMEFLANGDDSRVWRVAFQSGQPKLTGFDD